MSQIAIRKEALFVLHTLQQAGYDAYIVGGVVRDLFNQAGETQNWATDYDFTTNAKPEEIKALFPESFYENQFGTVSVTHQELLKQMRIDVDEAQLEGAQSITNRIIDSSQATKLHSSLTGSADTPKQKTSSNFLPNFEITTYRSQEIYTDFRRPDPALLEWGQTIEEDLARRDFTVNAMAISVEPSIAGNLIQAKSMIANLNHDQYTLVDPYQGMSDLQQGVIRTVGDPNARFQEDALRMLRAIRFSVQLNMNIEPKTFDAIAQNRELIAHVSWERIGDEFMKMMKSAYPAEAIALLDETGLLIHIIPELLEGKGVQQGGHHTTDVWTHSIDALHESPSHDPIVRLATLLHDIGKPATYELRNGEITFYNHEIVGSRIASAIAKRLRLSKHTIQRIFTLVRYHMFYYQPHHTDAAVRRFMRNVGLENIDDMLDLREADRLGSGARKTSWRLEEMKERMIAQLHQPMDVTDLAINGHDLMTELGLQPGPTIGNVLQKLLEEVLENPELNQKETLLEKAKKLI